MTTGDGKRVIHSRELHTLLSALYARVLARMPDGGRIYGVPRGGVPVAMALAGSGTLRMVDTPDQADAFVDDLIDSGRTKGKLLEQYPGVPFFALIDKPLSTYKGEWIVFPWEVSQTQSEGSSEDIFVRLLQFIGEDPSRGGLKDTPSRMARAWKQWTAGYQTTRIEDVVRSFDDGAENYDQQILVRDIPFYSHCEHHLAPFFGTVTVGYIPDKRILGLSKVSRIVDVYARRLQVQERLTVQIAEALFDVLKPLGVGVRVTARHLCMESRGICKQGHDTVTCALRGAHMDKPGVREEFLTLASR